ncbi:transcriptional regulator, GntR family with aminotransferase domain protein, partial [mine drainage metagenome]
PTGDLIGDLRAAVQDDPTFFGAYGPLAGEGGLRSRIAAYLGEDGARLRADDVLITNGAQQGLDLIARAFVEPGDVVAIESPTYPAAIDVFRARGAVLHPVPVDAQGLQVERLGEIRNLRLVYTVPDFHNPTGAILSDGRRRALVDLARERGFLVVEDDPWREINFGEPLPPPLRTLP